jgi:hypothetical protein
MTTNIYNTHFLPNSSSRTRMWTIFYLQPPAYWKGEFLPQARCRIKSIPFGKYRRYSITSGYYNDLLMMYKLKSKLIPNERPSRNMMYKLKNNIVRVDASSKLIPNERPPETTSRHCAFHHARPQYGRICSILERSRNGTPCLTVLSLPWVLNASRLSSVIKLKWHCFYLHCI